MHETRPGVGAVFAFLLFIPTTYVVSWALFHACGWILARFGLAFLGQ